MCAIVKKLNTCILNRTVRVWRIPSGDLVHTMRGHVDDIEVKYCS